MATTEQAPVSPPPAEQRETPAREQIAACLKNLSKDDYDELLNEMMTKDF